MVTWFRFGQLHHIQTQANPQVAACGTQPMNPQPTFESEDKVDYACRGCTLALVEDMLTDEDIEDSIGRGYEVVGPAD